MRASIEKNLGELHAQFEENEVIDVCNKLTVMFYNLAVARANFCSMVCKGGAIEDDEASASC